MLIIWNFYTSLSLSLSLDLFPLSKSLKRKKKKEKRRRFEHDKLLVSSKRGATPRNSRKRNKI